MGKLLFSFFESLLFVGGAMTIFHAFAEDGYGRLQRAAYAFLGGIMLAVAVGLLAVFVWRCF